MSKSKLLLFFAVCALASTLLPHAASARVQVYQDFDTGWEGTPWTGYSNNVTDASGWVVNLAKIYTNTTDVSFNAELYSGTTSTNAWIQSPFLSNGVGSIIYSARMYGTLATYTSAVAVEVQYEGDSHWIAIATNIIPQPNTYNSFTNFINSDSNQTVRLRKIVPGTGVVGHRILFDNIYISYPAAFITNIAVTLSPPTPTVYDAMCVTAAVSVLGFPDSIAATNFWRSWPATNWTAIAMTTNELNIFHTVTNMPGLPPGSTIDYFVQTAHSYTQKVYFTTTSVFNVSIRPRSSFTNMLITTTPATSMHLGSSYQWQGIVDVTNSNPSFKFKGTANGTDTLWGELNQAVSNLPLYGTAETNGNDITLFTTTSGYYVFKLNETNSAFDVRPCTYEDFSAWTNSAYQAPGIFTNTSDWTLSGGSISNDPTRSRVAILSGIQGTTTNYIQSPQLTNGIGEISFWYRNGATNGNPTTALSLQAAPSTNSTSWTTVGTITNISSATYIFASFPVSDLNNQCLRFLNHTAGTNSRVWLDDIVIAAPGPGVQAFNLSHSPSDPSMVDPVTISINLIPRNGATITNALTWYRNSTNLAFDSIPMVLGNGLYSATIPPTAGTVQYAVEYYYTGYQAISPVFFPASGTNSPSSYTATNIIDNVRFQDFDTGWTGTPWTPYTNNVTNAYGWVVNLTRIYTNSTDVSFIAELYSGPSSTNAWIQSPLLSNGVGSVIYSARMNGTLATYTSAVAVEVQYEGDTNWIAIATNIIPQPNTYNSFTNFFDTFSNQTVRLRKIVPGTGVSGHRIFVDNILITYPPATVSISNVTPNPGYPQAGQSASVSCDILSLNPFFPAFNITPRLWYTYSGITTSIPMRRITGDTYATITPISLTNATRDKEVLYWVKCDFAGFYAIPYDNRSPTYSVTNSFVVRAFSSAYQDIGISVNGSNTWGRLLTNGLWQSIFTTSSTNSLSFAIQGSGYSSGSGYSTNMTIWGNTNDWQTTLPIADSASIGQTNFDITGEFSGQYVMRFDETTGQYVINKCIWQDFDNWVGSSGLYKRDANDNAPLLQCNLDAWTPNVTQVRSENFNSADWLALNVYTNIAFGGPLQYGIYNSKITTITTGNGAPQTLTNALKGTSFIVQGSRFPTVETPSKPALQGIGTISFKYRAGIVTNNSFGIFAYTNPVGPIDDYFVDTRWVPIGSSFITNTTTFVTRTIVMNTNATMDIIFAHLTGASIPSTALFDDISVSEWYADSQTNSGWYTSEGWIERIVGTTTNYCVRFDTTRADPGMEQFICSPMLSNGVNAISFKYCSATANTTVSFNVESRTEFDITWSNMVSVTDSNFTGTASNSQYRSFSWTVGTPATNTFIRIVHTTNAPGTLLLQSIKIGGAAVGAVWQINNVCIDDTDHPDPPQPLGIRQFYAGTSYLNSNRTANLASGDSRPYTNVWPYIFSPIITQGVGEISFWYRNWTTSGAVTPARLLIQTTTEEAAIPSMITNNAAWSTVAILDGIVNTNDYNYFQFVVNDTNSRYVRIANDDQYTSRVGRVCIDDILIAAPVTASLSISNLAITPTIPLYSNTVHVTAEISQLFLAPSNITLTAYYATATTYAALSSASPIALAMSCIESNPTVPGQRYRYQTTAPIPTNATDTFVKYYVQAAYEGYQAASVSPKTLSAFETVPAWHAPIDYGKTQAFYVVYSCPTGSVWINEFNPMDDGAGTWIFTNEFIELCGPGGASIRDWTIELVDFTGNQIALYTVTNNTALHSTTNGHGFWLLGVPGIPAIDQELSIEATDGETTWEPAVGTRKMAVQGGIRLRRSWGPYEHSIFYNIPDIELIPPGYVLVGIHPATALTGSLGLTGTGTNYADFAWNESGVATPNQLNDGQVFPGETIPPLISIYRFMLNTNIWIECTKAVNWVPVPLYSTNLLASNSWLTVPSFTRSTSGSNELITFGRATNSPAFFYKIVSTNAP